MSRTSTILPPPSDYPVPLPEMAPAEPDSGAWRALSTISRETERPGILGELWAALEAEIDATTPA